MTTGRLAVRARMLAALGAMVALNALFVTVVAWLYLVLLPTLVGGAFLYYATDTLPPFAEFLRLPLSPPVLGGVIVAFLGGQIYYGYTRVLADVRTGAVGPDAYPRLHAHVGRLAASADVPAPDVAVIDAETPNSFTVGGGRSATVVVTASLLAVLDDAQLETVLAHEIAHVKHRDVTLMTVTGLFVAIADRTLRGARLLRRGVTDWDGLSRPQQLALDWLFPVVVFTYVVVAPVLWLFPPVARFASGQLSRQREYAADRAAAELTGAPTTLARALIRVHEASPAGVATTDLRRERAGMQALCVVPYGVVDEAEPEAVDADDASGQSGGESAGSPDASSGSDRGDPAWATTVKSAKVPPDEVEPAAAEAGTAEAGGSASDDDAGPDARPDPPTLDPDEWLATTNSSRDAAARTHPPIERRVERLVDLAG